MPVAAAAPTTPQSDPHEPKPLGPSPARRRDVVIEFLPSHRQQFAGDIDLRTRRGQCIRSQHSADLGHRTGLHSLFLPGRLFCREFRKCLEYRHTQLGSYGHDGCQPRLLVHQQRASVERIGQLLAGCAHRHLNRRYLRQCAVHSLHHRGRRIPVRQPGSSAYQCPRFHAPLHRDHGSRQLPDWIALWRS